MPDTAPAAPAPLFDRLGGRPRLRHLLNCFYADVRQHTEIAPIFAAHIAGRPAHPEKIADFWSGATGGPVFYCGAMPLKPGPLGPEERHFQAWLGLWSRHCRAHRPAAGTGEVIAGAESLGRRLRQIVAWDAGLARPAPV